MDTYRTKTLYFTVGYVGCQMRPDKSLTSSSSEAARFTTFEAALEFARNPNGVPGIHDREITEHYENDLGQEYERTAATGVL